jgi:hypothetical protein
VVDHEGDAEHGLVLGLVPAREGPPGVGGLELGGGDDLFVTCVVDERRAVEASELVVELARELDVQDDSTSASRSIAEVSRRVPSASIAQAPSMVRSRALQHTSAVGWVTSRVVITVPVNRAAPRSGRRVRS